MGSVTLFKMLKALALFLREMWLRDRTFRQFVHENLPLIFTSTGFVVMAALFFHVILIVKDQEKTIEDLTRSQTDLRQQIDEKVPYLTDQLAWYKEKYYDLKAGTGQQNVKEERASTKPVQPKPLPAPRQKPENPPVSNRPPSSDMVERWRRLSE